MKTTSVSDLMSSIIKRGINAILSPLDLQITRVYPNQACTLQWLEQAKQAGMEINDFIEKDQLKPALLELEKLVFPIFPRHREYASLAQVPGVIRGSSTENHSG